MKPLNWLLKFNWFNHYNLEIHTIFDLFEIVRWNDVKKLFYIKNNNDHIELRVAHLFDRIESTWKF